MPVMVKADYLIKLDIERIKKNLEEISEEIEKTPLLVKKEVISKDDLIKQLHSFWNVTCYYRDFWYWTYREEEED